MFFLALHLPSKKGRQRTEAKGKTNKELMIVCKSLSGHDLFAELLELMNSRRLVRNELKITEQSGESSTNQQESLSND